MISTGKVTMTLFVNPQGRWCATHGPRSWLYLVERSDGYHLEAYHPTFVHSSKTMPKLIPICPIGERVLEPEDCDTLLGWLSPRIEEIVNRKYDVDRLTSEFLDLFDTKAIPPTRYIREWMDNVSKDDLLHTLSRNLMEKAQNEGIRIWGGISSIDAYLRDKLGIED